MWRKGRARGNERAAPEIIGWCECLCEGALLLSRTAPRVCGYTSKFVGCSQLIFCSPLALGLVVGVEISVQKQVNKQRKSRTKDDNDEPVLRHKLPHKVVHSFKGFLLES